MTNFQKKIYTYLCIALLLIITLLLIFVCQKGVIDKNSFIYLSNQTSLLNGENITLTKFGAQTAIENGFNERPFAQNASATYFSVIFAKCFGGYNGWIIFSFICVILSLVMLFLLLKPTMPTDFAFAFCALYFVSPIVFTNLISITPYIFTSLVAALLLYVYYLKERYLLKWYLIILICTVLTIDNNVFALVGWLMIGLAFYHIKSQRNTWTAVLNTFLMTLMLLFMFYCEKKFFPDYFDTAAKNLPSIKNFFEKSNLAYLIPAIIMVFISFLGLLKTAKYARKKIYPAGFAFLIILILIYFNHQAKDAVIMVFPALMLGFSTSVVHSRIFRKIKKPVFFALLSCVVISVALNGVIGVNKRENATAWDYLNNIKTHYTKNIPLWSKTLVICDKEDFYMQDYLLPKRLTVILEEGIGNLEEVISLNNPQFIICNSNTQLDGYYKIYSFNQNHMAIYRVN